MRFAVDDEALAEIQRENGLPSLEVTVVGALGKNPQNDSAFKNLRARIEVANLTDSEAPWYLSLLAMQVLAAARMDHDEWKTAGAYWPRFQRLFEMEETPNQKTREYFALLWKALATYLEVIRKGEHGVLALPADPDNIPYQNRRLINLPISQVLVRRADRAPLSELFDRAELRGLMAEQLVDRVANDTSMQYGLSPALKVVLRQVADADGSSGERSNLREALVEVFGDIRAAAVHKRPVVQRGLSGESKLWPIRLVIRRVDKMLDVALQIDRGAGGRRDWVDIVDADDEPIELNSEDLLQGVPQTPYVDNASSVEQTLYLANDYDIIAFVQDSFDGSYAYYPRHWKREYAGGALRLLGEAGKISEVVAWYDRLRDDRRDVTAPAENKLVERLNGLACVDIILPVGVDRADLPQPLQRFVSGSASPRPGLIGFKVDGSYLCRTPLRMMVEWPDDIGHEPSYEYDGRRISISIDDGLATADLTEFTQVAGTYKIRSLRHGDHAIPEFTVADHFVTDFSRPEHGVYFNTSFLEAAGDHAACGRFRRMAEGGTGVFLSGATLLWRDRER